VLFSYDKGAKPENKDLLNYLTEVIVEDRTGGFKSALNGQGLRIGVEKRRSKVVVKRIRRQS